MNKQQTSQLLAVIKLAYPVFDITEESIRLWHDFLKEVPFEAAQQHLREHIQTSRFPPTIADVLQYETNKEKADPQIESRNREIAFQRAMNSWPGDPEKFPFNAFNEWWESDDCTDFPLEEHIQLHLNGTH